MAEAERPATPVLVFDGECGFCTGAADWVRRHARGAVRVLPGQAADLAALGLRERDVKEAAWWIDERGRRHRGHRAMARALAHCGGNARWLGLALERPLLSPFAAAGYALASRYRGRLPGTTPACRDPRGWPEASRSADRWPEASRCSDRWPEARRSADRGPEARRGSGGESGGAAPP